MDEHDPKDIEFMARFLAEVDMTGVSMESYDENAWQDYLDTGRITLDHMKASGLKITSPKATPQMLTDGVNAIIDVGLDGHDGVGRPEVHDIWLAIHDTAPLTPRQDKS